MTKAETTKAQTSAAHPERGTSAASRIESGAEESPTPETLHPLGQFGPLPLMLRPSPPVENEDRRNYRVSGKKRVAILGASAVVLAAVLAWALASAVAQQQPAPSKPAASPPAKNAPPPSKQQPQPTPQQQQGQQQPAMPVTTEQALYLIRSTLLTLNDANRSGNYTVLRDLAAPDFQARNTAADLSQSFSDLRRRNFDLYGAALLSPQLTAVPAVDQRGFLRLTGMFPTRPQQINFDLLFANVANQWRLFGISVATPDVPTAAR